MSNPKFVLAKYVPNLSRMEPRNIGIFLWSNGRLLARFLESTEVDFVNDPATFDEWKSGWMDMVNRKEIFAKGRAVSTKTEDCLKALLDTQNGNYLLVNAGFIPETVPASELPMALDYLFNELVSLRREQPDYNKEATFSQICDGIFESIGIKQHPNFKTNRSIECQVFGITHPLNFDYYLGNGHPEALIKRVKVRSNDSVNSCALASHSIVQSRLLTKNECCAMYRSTEVQSPIAAENLELLQKVCTLVDVDDVDRAIDQVSSLVSSLPSLRPMI
jgi:hypothetical protein